MHASTLFTLAFAATALAMPFKRDDVVVVVTATSVVETEVTNTVVTTINPAPQTPTPTPSPSTSSSSIPAKVNAVNDGAWTSAWTSSWTSVYVTTPTPSSTPSSSAAPPPSSSTSSVPVSGVNQTYVDQHNLHRANHSVPLVSWNDTLYASAVQVGSACDSNHIMNAMGGGYGQNYFMASYNPTVEDGVTNAWYGEYSVFDPYFGEATPTWWNSQAFDAWGHFTQVVWRDTQTIGCYVQNCQKGVSGWTSNPSYLQVCNYYPEGNVATEFNTNVNRGKDG